MNVYFCTCKVHFWTLKVYLLYFANKLLYFATMLEQRKGGNQLIWAVFFWVVTALYTGGQPARKLTRRPFFVEGCLRALSREACFREMLSRTLLFSTSWNESCHIFMATSFASLAHLPLHGHILPFMATYSTSLAHLPLHWHIFLFIRTSSPSSAHLPLHGYIFLFIRTSSPSSAHLPVHGYIFLLRTRGGGVGGTWFASARAFARLAPGYARDPERKMPNQIHAALAYSKLARRNLKDWSQICLRRLLTRRLSWSFREVLTRAYANL